MEVTILPSQAGGRIKAPPSKSMAHRMLICAGLAGGTSVISNIDFSEDILATIDCLTALGAEISRGDRSVTVRGISRVTVPRSISGGTLNQGCEKNALKMRSTFEEEDAVVLDCRECGSTLRFMIPLCLMSGRTYHMRGSRTLLARPLTVYENICASEGLEFVKEEKQLTVSGILRAGEYEIPGGISSQFVSGLLFALPLLDGDSRIRLVPPVVSRSYIGMTMQAQEMFGISAEWEDDFTIRVPGGQKYRARDARVEGDYSTAAFFEALNLAGTEVTGGDTADGEPAVIDMADGNSSGKDAAGRRVNVEGLREDSLQGDRVYRQYFDRIEKGYAQIDLSDCPDLGPVLIAAAALQHGARLSGTRRLRFKESDRGRAMQRELRKMGVQVEILDNEILIPAGTEHPEELSDARNCSGPFGVRRPDEPLDGHNDHRVVMALAVVLTKTGGTIRGAEAVKKSLPDFWERLERLGVGVTYGKE